MAEEVQKKKIVFVVNPISGTLGKKAILRQIKKLLDKERFDYTICPTRRAGHATEIARQAVAEGAFAVCAVGGDGTVNEVARSLVHTDTALAIIPCGSGNGLARHLHIPMDATRAIRMLNAHEVQTIDYGQINDHLFFCTCGVGFDAFISQRFAESGKRGMLTYVENVLQTALTYHPETYELEVVNKDAVNETYKAVLIACANASQYGNNAYIAPHASVRDGLLDVVIIEPFSPMEAPRMAFHLLQGTLDRHSRIKTLRCRRLSIHRKEGAPIHVDGDPMLEAADVEVAIVPQGLRCICPTEEGVESMKTSLVNVWKEYANNFTMYSKDLWENNMFRKRN